MTALDTAALSRLEQAATPGQALEIARRLYRGLEMQAEIMRDSARTGGWRGAENVARAFERQAEKARELHSYLADRDADRTRIAALEEALESARKWLSADLKGRAAEPLHQECMEALIAQISAALHPTTGGEA